MSFLYKLVSIRKIKIKKSYFRGRTVRMMWNATNVSEYDIDLSDDSSYVKDSCSSEIEFGTESMDDVVKVIFLGAKGVGKTSIIQVTRAIFSYISFRSRAAGRSDYRYRLWPWKWGFCVTLYGWPGTAIIASKANVSRWDLRFLISMRKLRVLLLSKGNPLLFFFKTCNVVKSRFSKQQRRRIKAFDYKMSD